ncbi:MAG: ADP-ribosylglycohydrolase family protein [Eubacteriaceae bacterium]|nr:ADP-ribosylglycohydrolase family protein [Eubacteriaceae bacterium]
MTCPTDVKLNSSENARRSRIAGCILGGAVGDALGFDVEFSREERIFSRYGIQGIRTLEQAGDPALISDDTQMSLFNANALIADIPAWEGYRLWLATQEGPRGIEEAKHPGCWIYDVSELHDTRAPGNTCLGSLRGGVPGRIDYPLNNSKGCGTVMRAAPCALAYGLDLGDTGKAAGEVFDAACADGALTHSHPLGYLSSGAMALVIWYILRVREDRDADLADRVREAMAFFRGDDHGLKALIEKALRLAKDEDITDLEGIHELGEGWTAEEALAIALFCAVRHQDDFGKAIRAAVNHSGDSDSTGAVCGNILGAWLGEEAVKDAFDTDLLELRDVIEIISRDMFIKTEHGAPDPGEDPEWDRKYRR